MELASQCYGYGHWDAPYWFIGPEQGQARREQDDLTARLEAFRKLSSGGLSDCRSFHLEIHETSWHRETPQADLQPTWKFLILALKAFLGEATGTENRRIYQCREWGSSTGETCVIELSGLPASDFQVVRSRELFRQQRLEFIHSKMISTRPKFVILYSKSQAEHWKRFWRENTIIVPAGDIVKLPFTTVAFAPQPTAPGYSSNEYWISLGQKLRQQCDSGFPRTS